MMQNEEIDAVKQFSDALVEEIFCTSNYLKEANQVVVNKKGNTSQFSDNENESKFTKSFPPVSQNTNSNNLVANSSFESSNSIVDSESSDKASKNTKFSNQLKSPANDLMDESNLVTMNQYDLQEIDNKSPLLVDSAQSVNQSNVDSKTNEEHSSYEIDENDFSHTNETASSSRTKEQNKSNVEKVDSHSNWCMLSGIDGSYYWNVDTGATQFETPTELQNDFLEDNNVDSPDSSLADLEGAAFRYASLHINEDSSTDKVESIDWTMSSDSGTMFSVRSLGWLPLEHFSSNPETSSSEVNACIKQLSSSHGQFMDSVGAWGDGKDLMLLIEDEHLKLLDPLSQTVLQTQAIKHIRVWGVGGSSPHDFAYVARDDITRQYKCHVFRSDAAAKAIAQELHLVCEKLHSKVKNKALDMDGDNVDKEQIAMSISMPVPKSEPISKFAVQYLGVKSVQSANGIQTIKTVIRDITTSNTALCVDCNATISASALILYRKTDDAIVINCRMRCVSFMGIGDDISLFAFIHVVGKEANCYVLQCQPNAAKLALAVQEACVLRYQKAIDSKQVTNQDKPELSRRKSFKQYLKNVFSKKNSPQ